MAAARAGASPWTNSTAARRKTALGLVRAARAFARKSCASDLGKRMVNVSVIREM
jgi:hypothetical protein